MSRVETLAVRITHLEFERAGLVGSCSRFYSFEKGGLVQAGLGHNFFPRLPSHKQKRDTNQLQVRLPVGKPLESPFFVEATAVFLRARARSVAKCCRPCLCGD